MNRFPSGPWVGFYTYSGHRRKYLMDLILEFKEGKMAGEGHDDIGGFVVSGGYSDETHECFWKKTYVGRHTVEYQGFAEGLGIWGTWTLPGARGGFQIWPLGQAPAAMAVKEAALATESEAEPAGG